MIVGQLIPDASTVFTATRRDKNPNVVLIRHKYTSKRTNNHRHCPRASRSHGDSRNQTEDVDHQNNQADSPVVHPYTQSARIDLSTTSTLVSRPDLQSCKNQRRHTECSTHRTEHPGSLVQDSCEQDIGTNITLSPSLRPLSTSPQSSDAKAVLPLIEYEGANYELTATKIREEEVPGSTSEARSSTTCNLTGDFLSTSILANDKDGRPPKIVAFARAIGEHDLQNYMSMINAICDVDSTLLDDISVAEMEKYPNSWMPDFLEYCYPD